MKDTLVFYMHAGSQNHGCEAIVNALCHMIQEKPLLVSYAAGQDAQYTLPKLCSIVQERSFEEHKIMHLLYALWRMVTGDKESFIRFRYKQVFGQGNIPLAISIGGDNYCYDTMLNDLRLTNAAFGQKGIKTVLLGCSIEPELLHRKDILEDLQKYHTIIARESITYEALQAAFAGYKGAAPALFCCPDPAFTLQSAQASLPAGFAVGNTVGVNISPMIQDNEKDSGITMECYAQMIEWLIGQTDMQIALIPHVVWSGGDDRIPIQALHEKYKLSGRVIVVEDMDCQKLKGIIGQCRFFVGARTHATIAAYSSCVPTLVVGYSVKARGIARDLFGTEENYVIPVQSLKDTGDLTKGFRWLLEHEEVIRNHLADIMPAYREKAYQTGKEVDRIWKERTGK